MTGLRAVCSICGKAAGRITGTPSSFQYVHHYRRNVGGTWTPDTDYFVLTPDATNTGVSDLLGLPVPASADRDLPARCWRGHDLRVRASEASRSRAAIRRRYSGNYYMGSLTVG